MANLIRKLFTRIYSVARRIVNVVPSFMLKRRRRSRLIKFIVKLDEYPPYGHNDYKSLLKYVQKYKIDYHKIQFNLSGLLKIEYGLITNDGSPEDNIKKAMQKYRSGDFHAVDHFGDQGPIGIAVNDEIESSKRLLLRKILDNEKHDGEIESHSKSDTLFTWNDVKIKRLNSAMNKKGVTFLKKDELNLIFLARKLRASDKPDASEAVLRLMSGIPQDGDEELIMKETGNILERAQDRQV